MVPISEQQEKIILILQIEPLSFNNLKKRLEIESNKLSYHIQILKKNDLIALTDKKYALTSKAEHIIPLLSIFSKKEKPVITVVAVALIEKEHIYLQKKPRAPDRNTLIFFGGKCKHHMSLEDSAKLYVKEQAKTTAEKLKLRAIHEYITKKKENIVDHWIVFFYTAKPNEIKNTIKRNIETLKEKELYGDNFELLKTINSRTPKFKKIVKSI